MVWRGGRDQGRVWLTLLFRRGASRHASLADFYCASGWRSCGVVITKFSDHVVIFRSSPTLFADTPVPASASTRILAGKPLRAMSSAAMLLHLYRGIKSSLVSLSGSPSSAMNARGLFDQPGWQAKLAIGSTGH